MRNSRLPIAVLTVAAISTANAELKFKQQKIDDIEIGYGIQLADVDGDKKTDIVLADKKTIQWYPVAFLETSQHRQGSDRTRQRVRDRA